MPTPKRSSPWARALLAVLLTGVGATARADAPVQLTLDEARVRFREDAPTIRQLAARTQEARAMVRLATAQALPVLAAQGGYIRNNADARVDIQGTFQSLADSLPVPVDIDTSNLPGELIIQPLEAWNAGAQLTVPLVAASAWADISAARAAVASAAAQEEAARLQAETALVRAAWLTGAARANVDATSHAEATAREHLQTAQARLRAGVGTDLEVLAASTELDRRTSDRLQAEADLGRARRALGAILGMDQPVDVVLPAPDAGMVPDPDDAADRAVLFRPELLAAHAAWQAATRQATSAWLRHVPAISFTGNVAAQTVDYPTGLPTAWRVGLQATWVLYDGGARYGLLHQARARRAQAEAAEIQARLDARREAVDAVDGVQVALARRALASSALATADEAEASASRAYAAGLIGSTDVLDAQQRRLDAAVAVAAADAQLGIARAEVARTTGSGG